VRRSTWFYLGLLTLAATAALSEPALAESGPGPGREIVVRYSGPAECSSARAFIQRVAPRLPSVRLVEHGQTVGLDVVLAEDDGGVSAELVIHLESGGTSSRSILASTCDEATEAIAFVAAVALDPGAAEPVVVQSAEDDVVREPNTLSSASGAAHAEPAGGERHRRRSGGEESGNVGLLGVGAAVGFGVAPEAMIGPDVSLGWSFQKPGAWSPGLVVGAQYLLSGGYRQPAGVASFQQGLGRFELCPSRFGSNRLSFSPCLGLGAGWVQSEGTETDEPAQVTRPYFDTRLAGYLQLGLGRQSALVLSGYAAVPWIRDSYQFDAAVFHQTAAITGGLALSIGARLW